MSETSPANKPLDARVREVIDSVRPYIQADGGDIELVAIEGDVVKVKLRGACASCPMSQMTLKAGVERHMRERVPEIRTVESVG
jgi:Fe-S cluster biogenesis protein NfuA